MREGGDKMRHVPAGLQAEEEDGVSWPGHEGKSCESCPPKHKQPHSPFHLPSQHSAYVLVPLPLPRSVCTPATDPSLIFHPEVGGKL